MRSEASPLKGKVIREFNAIHAVNDLESLAPTK